MSKYTGYQKSAQFLDGETVDTVYISNDDMTKLITKYKACNDKGVFKKQTVKLKKQEGPKKETFYDILFLNCGNVYDSMKEQSKTTFGKNWDNPNAVALFVKSCLQNNTDMYPSIKELGEGTISAARIATMKNISESNLKKYLLFILSYIKYLDTGDINEPAPTSDETEEPIATYRQDIKELLSLSKQGKTDNMQPTGNAIATLLLHCVCSNKLQKRQDTYQGNSTDPH